MSILNKCISFDFDRTLAHVSPLSHHIIPELLNEKGFKVTVEEFKKICEAMHETPPEHLLDRYHRFGSLPKTERAQFNKEYNFARIKSLNLSRKEEETDKIIHWVTEEVHHRQKKILYDDVKKTILKLSQMGKSLYVLSGNHSDGIIEILQNNQLLDYFEEIITVNKYSMKKTDNFQVLLDHSKISPEEIVHIGDDVLTDGLGAERFNIRPFIIRRKSQLVYDNEKESKFTLITNLNELFQYL